MVGYSAFNDVLNTSGELKSSYGEKCIYKMQIVDIKLE
jgi:hypothetical protein